MDIRYYLKITRIVDILTFCTLRDRETFLNFITNPCVFYKNQQYLDKLENENYLEPTDECFDEFEKEFKDYYRQPHELNNEISTNFMTFLHNTKEII